MALKRVIAITGCDSGLGWALAARAAREGLVTVAGLFNGVDSKAAEDLKRLAAHPHALDVTKSESVEDFQKYVMKLLSDNPDYRLYALVNNAGVMTIGDYEWQTAQMIENTIDVNLLGTMSMVSTFLPHLRKVALEGAVKPRIINVASHCGLQPLPAFATYSASKAAVLAFTQALRLEQRPHGLSAVAFIPGGFISASNLISNQRNKAEMMLRNLDEEQNTFYGPRIKALMEYLGPQTSATSHDSLKDTAILETLMKAIQEDRPMKMYKVECWRYKLYYNLMKLPLPEAVNYWLIKKFVNFPEA